MIGECPMINCKLLNKKGLLAFVLIAGLAICAPGRAAQEPTFDWQATNDQTVRLDPSGYHTGQVFKSRDHAGNVHVDIEAQEPVTVEMAPTGEWSEALRHPELLPRITFRCVNEHVVKMTYACEVAAGRPMTLVIRDERDGGRTANVGFGAGVDERGNLGGTVRDFVAPNDIHINYYRWICVEHCNPPQYQWTTELKERYEVTRAMKIYGGMAADRDGEPFSVNFTSPVPMTVAIVPTRMAERARERGNDVSGAVGNGNCTQRGAQSGTFECTFDVSDGPLSVVAAPEGGGKLGSNEKAEVEVSASKCVANCLTPVDTQKADSDK
jgi:hypothetical protein